MQTNNVKKIVRKHQVSILHPTKGVNVTLKEGDAVEVMEPEMIVEKGVMNDIVEAQEFLLRHNINIDYSPFDIYEISECEGETFVTLSGYNTKCTIPAKFCTAN